MMCYMCTTSAYDENNYHNLLDTCHERSIKNAILIRRMSAYKYSTVSLTNPRRKQPDRSTDPRTALLPRNSLGVCSCSVYSCSRRPPQHQHHQHQLSRRLHVLASYTYMQTVMRECSFGTSKGIRITVTGVRATATSSGVA